MIIHRSLKVFLITVIIIVITPILLFHFYSYQASLQYKDVLPPNFTHDTTTNKTLYVDSPKKLVMSLVANEEYFKGYINLKYLNLDKVVITMRNESTGDDSITAIEYFIIAERSKPGWTIVQYKAHWKCRGLLFLNFWTTKACS